MPKVLILKGLPGSGKSFWGKDYIKLNPNTKRINKDLLREMLDFSEWNDRNEKLILQVRDTLLKKFIVDGYDVIIDDTNLSPKHEKRIKSILSKEIEIKIIDHFLKIPVEKCIERDSLRDKPVGEDIIRQMYKQFISSNSFSEISLHQLQYKKGREEVIIVDIDGTLALHNGRSPFEYNKCDTDLPNIPIINIVNQLRYRIIIVSGREDYSAEKTKNWLNNNNVSYNDIYMRKSGDYRKDTIIKKEIYKNYIEGKYNVAMVIDDRPKVIRMWKELNLPVFDVGKGVEF